MKKRKGGFTIIEVSLFLAITGALFVAVTIGVQNSIFQQRYNDAVQDFAELLRRVYGETMNVQSSGTGRSGQAIYGKLVTFGESRGLNGAATNGEMVFIYDVVGNVGGEVGSGKVIDTLGSNGINADVIVDAEGGGKKPAGIAESYRPKWSTEIQPPCNGNNCEYTPFQGALLVIRHPRSGTVYTYVMEGKTVQVNQMLAEGKRSVLSESLNYFSIKQFDVCINPNGGEVNNNRADVRIASGATNSSAIETIFDVGDNKCRTK